MENFDQSQNKPESFSSFFKTEFKDFSLEMKIPLHYDQLKPITDALESFKTSDFKTFYLFLLEKLEELPSISHLKLVFPQTLLNQDQYSFLMRILLKLLLLQKKSIYLSTYIEKSCMTIWRDFYFRTFLKEIQENQADLSFLTRFKEYELNEISLIFMNNLLTFIEKDFKELKEFAFVNGNLDNVNQYPHYFKNITNLLHRFSHSLEKITLFFRSAWLKHSDYLPLFDAFEEMTKNNKLKSINIALGGSDEPVSSAIDIITKKLKSIFDNKDFTSLKEFQIFLANTHMKYETLRDFMIVLSQGLPRFKSMSFLIQTNFEFYKKKQMNELLQIFFKGKAEELQSLTIAFCADQSKNNKETRFDLKVFGSLLKENEWCLLEFNIYYEACKEVSKKDVVDFLIILTKFQEFLLNMRIVIIKKGLELVEAFGFSNILEAYLKEKKAWIVRGKVLKRLKKVYRIEILKEIMEKFL